MIAHSTPLTRARIVLIFGGALLAAFVVALLVTGVLWWRQAQTATPADATTLDGTLAPDFTLLNQDDQPIQLSALRGHVVVLTFLYTTCPDICPLTAHRLAAAYDQLTPQQQARVRILAVTVDPERDTTTRLRQYLDANGLTGKLQFLTGQLDQVAAVWQDYHIGVEKATPTPGTNAYTVNHTAVTYVLDAQGRERYLLSDESIDPTHVAKLLAKLAASS